MNLNNGINSISMRSGSNTHSLSLPNRSTNMVWSEHSSERLLVSVVSKTRVVPHTHSTVADMKLSVSDLPMLSCQYIQKGCLFQLRHHHDDDDVTVDHQLRDALSRALSLFPPLAGTLSTDSAGRVFLRCTDSGADFIHAAAPSLSLRHLLSPSPHLRLLFPFDGAVSHAGHSLPLLAVQITTLSDGLFLACSFNHAVADGTSFWHFFNTFARCCRGGDTAPGPDFSRRSPLVSLSAVLKLPPGGPAVTFSNDQPLVERIFSFTGDAVLSLKRAANQQAATQLEMISSFQSLCALLWRSVTRARRLPARTTTTFRMAVNCRHRLAPKLDPFYFGNAIQSVATVASAGDVVSRELGWSAWRLNAGVRAHDDEAVRRMVADWEREPRCFPLGNPDGASITMGSSPRFPMFDNDFGWGRPLAVRSGPANKFDGKMSAFPGRDGSGSVDLEVVLSSETMAALESDAEFMQYVHHRL